MRDLKILLAEDNAVNRNLAVRLLQKQGHNVTAVGNGREALSALERQSFDLILMDVQMPEMDGFEATRAIRRNERGTGKHTPVIAMTAHAMSGDRELCLSAGMDGYAPKPIRQADLAKEIVRVLGKCSGQSEPASSQGALRLRQRARCRTGKHTPKLTLLEYPHTIPS